MQFSGHFGYYSQVLDSCLEKFQVYKGQLLLQYLTTKKEVSAQILAHLATFIKQISISKQAHNSSHKLLQKADQVPALSAISYSNHHLQERFTQGRSDNSPETRFWRPQDRIQSVQLSSVAQSCLTLCDPMNRSTPGLPVHH